MKEFDINNESYDIEPELIVSDIINKHSELITTEKNEIDPYEYDLRVFQKYPIIGSMLKRYGYELGYIEVERSNYEYLGGKNWYHSFLMRKVFEWNDNQYHDQILKDKSEETVYIKFNHNYGLDDCICCCIEDITRFNPEWQRKTGNPRQDLVLRTNQNNSHVAKGIENCIDYIENFFFNGGKK